MNVFEIAESLTRQETVDVVVAGSGFAGLAAAIETRTAGNMSSRYVQKNPRILYNV